MSTGRVFRTAFWLLLITMCVAAGVAGQRLLTAWREADMLSRQLVLDAGPQSTLIYDRDGHVQHALFEEHRIAVPLGSVAPPAVDAVLVAEDRRFFEHDGVDLKRIASAALANVKAGRIVQGGSTITQQLVRNIALDRRRTYHRKLLEVLLARRLEQRYTKEEILEAYLNRVYFGNGNYGIEAAARAYFGKSAAALGPAEGATLAALIKGPAVYDPVLAPTKVRHRRDWVLRQMFVHHRLSHREFIVAVGTPLTLVLADQLDARGGGASRPQGGYFIEAVTRELLQRFDRETVYRGGLRVHTTMDAVMQAAAEREVSRRARELAGRSTSVPQGALVAMDAATGEVRALVGGRDFRESPFNRAVDARRQPGSAFKPFVFARAIEVGYTPQTWLDALDAPVAAAEGEWLPGGEHEVESVTLHDALVVSSNRAAAHLLQQVGVGPTIDLVQRFGIASPQPAVPSLALGTGGVTLLELTAAYGVFANAGAWRAPRLIARVEDARGRVIFEAAATSRQVLSEGAAYLMTSMLEDVVRGGTAAGVRAYGWKAPAAGKTGTSDDYADAWFVGFTPSLVVGVWFGHDRPQPLAARGFAGRVAVPAWARFMAAVQPQQAPATFRRPDSLVPVRLCALTGGLAGEDCERHARLADILSASPLDPPSPARPLVYDDLMEIHRVPAPCPGHAIPQ